MIIFFVSLSLFFNIVSFFSIVLAFAVIGKLKIDLQQKIKVTNAFYQTNLRALTETNNAIDSIKKITGDDFTNKIFESIENKINQKLNEISN